MDFIDKFLEWIGFIEIEYCAQCTVFHLNSRDIFWNIELLTIHKMTVILTPRKPL